MYLYIFTAIIYLFLAVIHIIQMKNKAENIKEIRHMSQLSSFRLRVTSWSNVLIDSSLLSLRNQG